MLDYRKDKINYELLLYDTKVELIIRAEESIKEKGIVIRDKSRDELNEIIDNIEEKNYKEVIDYLNENNIFFEEAQFI